MKKATLCRLLVFCSALLSFTSARAEQVNIATSSNPIKKIVIPTTSGTALQATANELKGFLNRMKSGTSTFVVETFDPAVGPNAGTIVLGKATDLNLVSQLDDPALSAQKDREHYLLASANSGTNIVIAGNTDLAISNGVYDLLERMGCGWFMPTAAWEVVPAASATVRWTTPATPLSTPTVTMGTKSMALKIYHDEVPDYKSRWLTNAFYNSGGGNNAHEWQQQWDEWVTWNKRNRQSQTLKINNTHAYGAIIAWAKSQTQPPNDPVNGRWKQEYYSLVSGQRGDPSNDQEQYLYQLCVSNTAVQQLCKDYAIAYFTNTKTAGEDSISLEPNDGTRYWCTCTSSPGAPNGCTALQWGLGKKDGVDQDADPANNDYFVTDRVVFLANTVAEHLAANGFGSKYVGILSYAKHSGWPSITIHPKVYVSIVNGYLSYGMTMPLLQQQWAGRRASGDAPNLGVYEYYSLFGADRGLPAIARGTNLKYLKTNLPAWHKSSAQVDMYTGESSYSLGALGLSLYVTHKLLWNVDTDVEVVRKDFLTKCFGAEGTPIYATMDQFFRRTDPGNGYQLSTDLIGRLFRYLDDAYGQTTNPKVIERLDALTFWLHYCEKLRNFEAMPVDNPGAIALRQTKAEELLIYLWQIRHTSIVDTLFSWKGQKTLGHNSDPEKDYFDWPVNEEIWTNYGGQKLYDDPTTPANPDVGYWPVGTLDLDASIPGPDATEGLGDVMERQPWKISGTFSRSDINGMVQSGITNHPLLAEEPRTYDHDLIPGGFPVLGQRDSFNQLRLKKIGLYLRTDASGAFPPFSMSTGHSQNKGNLPYTLYANDAISDLQTGTLMYAASASSAITFWNESPNSIYIFDMFDYNAGTRMDWAAGSKISMMARSDWPYSVAGGRKRYFYVPKGTKNIIAYAQSIGACTFYQLLSNGSGTARYIQSAESNGVDITIPIEPDQYGVWYVNPLLGSNFFFQNIPGVLATRQDELLLPKEAFAELVPSGGSGTATRGTFLSMNGTNAFYLRGDTLGMLPTLSISGTLSGTNTGTSTWKLLSEDGRTEYVSGTFVRHSSSGTFSIPVSSGGRIVPTSTTDTFLLVYDDKKTVSKINWPAGAKVTIAASPTYKHFQVGGVSRRYFFVPKGTKEVTYSGRSILSSTIYTTVSGSKFSQPQNLQAFSQTIPVNPGEDDQFWYFSTSFGASEFFFTGIPGLLSARPDEMLVPQWTKMNP